MIKVSELISRLGEFPGDAFVLVSSDAEGNTIRGLDGVDGTYSAEKDGYDFWLDGDGADYVVVWPV